MDTTVGLEELLLLHSPDLVFLVRGRSPVAIEGNPTARGA
jgi:hypothetical protein